MRTFAMTQDINDFELEQLRGRLQAAEVFATNVLKGAKEENPLYEPTRKLLAVHQEIREMLCDESDSPFNDAPADECRVHDAAIEIGREEHTMKADAKDMLKAFFMWKDDPTERANDKSA